ncbi:MAG TPA: MFS transporter [Pirellulales bacterium]|jgi:MFS family permease|nr:MFS transporter [Pirellulales bacterium]
MLTATSPPKRRRRTASIDAPEKAPARRPRGSRADLRAMLGDGAAFSVMVGMGESYLPAFALAAGLGEVAAGLVATVPLVAGAVLQLVSPAAVRRLGSHKRWVVLCAACQGLAFLPLAIGAYSGTVEAWLVFGMAAIYWGAGLATGPAWNTWAGTLVPDNIRTGFFARRTRFSQIGTLAGFVAGGVTLQWAKSWTTSIAPFAALFLGAALARSISASFLALQSEPQPPDDDHRRVSWRDLIGSGRADGPLLVYLFAVQAAAQFAGPYFTPFMLKQIHFSYIEYVLLIGVSFAAKAVALPALGRLARRIGARQLLWIGGLSIVPVSGMWVASTTFAYLIFVQVAAGLAWAAYELAMFLLFFEAIPEKERTSVLTIYNVGNSLATAVGAFLGGSMLWTIGERPATYLAIFGLSSVARLATLVLLTRVPRVDARAEVLPARGILSVRPAVGSVDRPILVSLPVDDGGASGLNDGLRSKRTTC